MSVDKKKKVMGEFHEGTLHSGSKKGPKITDPKQAVAIAYSEERAAKKSDEYQPDLIYQTERPYEDDINDLVEDEFEKGRGPDKQPRKHRSSLERTIARQKALAENRESEVKFHNRSQAIKQGQQRSKENRKESDWSRSVSNARRSIEKTNDLAINAASSGELGKGGPGSGVIRHTTSGKPIHMHNAYNHRHQNFTPEDHMDAVNVLRTHLPKEPHQMALHGEKFRHQAKVSQFIEEHKNEAKKKQDNQSVKKAHEATAEEVEQHYKDAVSSSRVEKGGPGSGVKGHKTAKEAGEGPVWRDKKTGLYYSHKDYMEHNRQGLMNYSGYDSKPGHYMSRHQVSNAIEQHTGHSRPTAHDIADHLEREGHIKRMGHLHVVMKPQDDKKAEPVKKDLSYGGM